MVGSLRDQLRTLHERAPTQYGLLKSHAQTVEQVLATSSHNYPTVKQLLASTKPAKLTPQMLGNLLSLCVRFGILSTHSERNNSNRYDLTQYDHERMDELTRILAQDPFS
ncbi:hypothetical protein SAMN05421858_4846 [Haladaptatus litoreus]|uniref:Uncharacterized protein n=1 Tax=Haladaptatus litoreus TaxID=553468 RepID=A0A1N7F9C7_9EURY|nr:hypothetical protein SAMN05421858_4846 [Haladaptatus litoreus]